MYVPSDTLTFLMGLISLALGPGVGVAPPQFITDECC